MDRREFVQKGLLAGAGLVCLGFQGCSGWNSSRSGPPPAEYPAPDKPEGSPASSGPTMAIIKGQNPEGLIKAGMEAMGGISRFIQKDHLVCIKPNFSVPAGPQSGCITNPTLVSALVALCLNAGAKEVRVIDHPFSNAAMCLADSGMQTAVEQAGGRIFVLDQLNDRNYYSTTLPGSVLGNIFYSRDVLDADVFINFPILKHHGSTTVTLGLKNLMGLVWDRGVFHANDLERNIAELASFKKPHLTIMDALRGITDNGPSGPGPIREYNQLILGLDPLAVDSYAAELFGIEPAAVNYLQYASDMGLGLLDWRKRQPVEKSL